jgi:hypothetical protein
MQTFSIFLSSGTDEKENVKSFIFHLAVFELENVLNRIEWCKSKLKIESSAGSVD